MSGGYPAFSNGIRFALSTGYLLVWKDIATPARNVPANVIECDEVWTFVKKKDWRHPLDRPGQWDEGSQFIATAMHRESKVVITYRVGKRVSELAVELISDLMEPVEGHPTIYAAKGGKLPQVPDHCDADAADISTLRIERQNWTLRTHMRRLTRLSNGFSRKLENLKAAVTLHYAAYNFCKPHRSLNGATPAMAAGAVGTVWKMSDLLPS